MKAEIFRRKLPPLLDVDDISETFCSVCPHYMFNDHADCAEQCYFSPLLSKFDDIAYQLNELYDYNREYQR